RHTSSDRDWSSDVCSSDLANIFQMAQEMYREERLIKRRSGAETTVDTRYLAGLKDKFSSTSSEQPIEYKAPPKGATPIATQRRRSEERRVGKEWRSREGRR